MAVSQGYTHLEDEFGDVVGKARRGQELSVAQVAAASQLAPDLIERVEAYELTPPADTVDRLARTLGLDAGRLRRSAQAAFFPARPTGGPARALDVQMLILGDDFLMNGYVVVCKQTREAAVVDPGFQPDRVLHAVAAAQARVTAVLLTHGHGDHVGGVAAILDAVGVGAAIAAADVGLAGDAGPRIEGRLTPGDQIRIGGQHLRVASTPGHTPGGVSLVHEEVAFVGDALFAGSVGGTRRQSDYRRQRQAVAAELLSLPPATTLYPGHGPATTVAEERDNNPFFGTPAGGEHG